MNLKILLPFEIFVERTGVSRIVEVDIHAAKKFAAAPVPVAA